MQSRGTGERRSWTTAGALLLVALVLGGWMVSKAPRTIAETTWDAAQERQRLLARNGAERVGALLAEVRRRLEDPTIRAASLLDEAVTPEALRRGLEVMSGPTLDRYGVVLLVHDTDGRVLATDPKLPPSMAAKMGAHTHRHPSGAWPGSEAAVGVCDKCHAHMEAASVAVPLASGMLLGANVDVERLAHVTLADIHSDGAEGAWVVDHHGHVIDSHGNLAEGDADGHATNPDWLMADAPVPNAAGWRVRVAAERASVAARALHETRSFLLAGGGVVGLLFAAAGFGFSALRRRQRAERERLERLAHQDKLASLGVIAASVGHEVRNLITAARGNVEFVRQLVDDEEFRSALGDTREALGRIQEIAEDMRRYGRQREEAPETMTLREPVEAALRLVRPRLGGRYAIELEIEDTPLILGRRGPLSQVFVNLLQNAVDAMEEHGGRHIRIALRNGGVTARAEVHDEGPGLSEEAAERLFTPFFTTKGADRGTGLGLALCARIIEEHGGSIRGTNGSDGGACFQVALPIATDHGSPCARDAPAP